MDRTDSNTDTIPTRSPLTVLIREATAITSDDRITDMLKRGCTPEEKAKLESLVSLANEIVKANNYLTIVIGEQVKELCSQPNTNSNAIDPKLLSSDALMASMEQLTEKAEVSRILSLAAIKANTVLHPITHKQQTDGKALFTPYPLLRVAGQLNGEAQKHKEAKVYQEPTELETIHQISISAIDLLNEGVAAIGGTLRDIAYNNDEIAINEEILNRSNLCGLMALVNQLGQMQQSLMYTKEEAESLMGEAA